MDPRHNPPLGWCHSRGRELQALVAWTQGPSPTRSVCQNKKPLLEGTASIFILNYYTNRTVVALRKIAATIKLTFRTIVERMNPPSTWKMSLSLQIVDNEQIARML